MFSTPEGLTAEVEYRRERIASAYHPATHRTEPRFAWLRTLFVERPARVARRSAGSPTVSHRAA
ncbi:MAG TPA: hypothetical protein VEZ46_11160 [Mycobacteriales bacterium]|nr:hypothetical protein [Mycobacteriales bacterium]